MIDHPILESGLLNSSRECDVGEPGSQAAIHDLYSIGIDKVFGRNKSDLDLLVLLVNTTKFVL